MSPYLWAYLCSRVCRWVLHSIAPKAVLYRDFGCQQRQRRSTIFFLLLVIRTNINPQPPSQALIFFFPSGILHHFGCICRVMGASDSADDNTLLNLSLWSLIFLFLLSGILQKRFWPIESPLPVVFEYKIQFIQRCNRCYRNCDIEKAMINRLFWWYNVVFILRYCLYCCIVCISHVGHGLVCLIEFNKNIYNIIKLIEFIWIYSTCWIYLNIFDLLDFNKLRISQIKVNKAN